MLSKLRDLFVLRDENETSSNHEKLHLAAAVLLVEVARSDFEMDLNEYSILRDRLAQIVDLGGADIEELVSEAESDLDHSVSLHKHVNVINENYSPKQKFNLICALWQVAYSDGSLHHYEEHLIRRLSDLLHVPHRDFIRAKHFVQQK